MNLQTETDLIKLKRLLEFHVNKKLLHSISRLKITSLRLKTNLFIGLEGGTVR